MKLILFLASFLFSFSELIDLDLNKFKILPSESFTIEYNDSLWGRSDGYKFSVKNDDSLTYYVEVGTATNEEVNIWRYIKLMDNMESHLLVVGGEEKYFGNEYKAGFVKWKNENKNFTFSDTTTLITSFKEEYIKILFPKHKGRIILSKAKEVSFSQDSEKLLNFLGFVVIPDSTKENLKYERYY